MSFCCRAAHLDLPNVTSPGQYSVNLLICNRPHQKSTHFIWKHTRRGGVHSHLLVDIKCLLIDPPFHADLTPNDPHFPLSYQILHTNWKYLGALYAFWEIYTFCDNFKIKFANFGLKIAVLHTKWPPFLGIHIKKIFFYLIFFFFLSSHRMTPSSVKSYTECPLLLFSNWHLHVTFIFEYPLENRASFF